MSARKPFPILWDVLPFVIILAGFLLIALINWDYEKKFFFPVDHAGRTDFTLGPIMLAIGYGLGIGSSGFLFMMRQCWAGDASGRSWADRMTAVLLGLISVVLFVAGLGIIVLGPAAFTMMEQMSSLPH